METMNSPIENTEIIAAAATGAAESPAPLLMKLDETDEEHAVLLQDLRQHLLNASGNSWGVILDKPNGLERFFATSRPCFGEMRAYGKESTRPSDSKPSDLPRPLPPGVRRLAAGVCVPRMAKGQVEPYINWMLTEGPFRALGKDYEIVSNTKSVTGVLFKDTDVDPTMLISFAMCMRHSAAVGPLLKEGVSNITTFLLTHLFNAWFSPSPKSWTLNLQNGYGYAFSPSPDLVRLMKGEFKNVSNNRSFLEGEDYNRPELIQTYHDAANPNLATLREIMKKGTTQPTGSAFAPSKANETQIKELSANVDKFLEGLVAA